MNCKTCTAKGNLRFFLKLTVAWLVNKDISIAKYRFIPLYCVYYRSVHTNDHIVETTAMPDHLVREAQGAVVFEESFVRVSQRFKVLHLVVLND